MASNYTWQVIYSDAGETGPEDFWKIYSLMLPPFALAIPASNVKLFLHSVFVNVGPDRRSYLTDVKAPSNYKWFPEGYLDYFWEVYGNAVDIDQYEQETKDGRFLVLPEEQYDFRCIAGHGFHDFVHGGKLHFGSKRLPFTGLNMGPDPKIITILDVCQSPYLVAARSGFYVHSIGNAFHWRKAWKGDNSRRIPVVCDKVPSTYGFRVGYHGQPDVADKDQYGEMTSPFGEAVAYSLLVAIKSFIDDGRTGANLDSRFKAMYKTLNKKFLPKDTNTPTPYSTLTKVQELIVEGSLQVNESAFDCELFRRSDKWYLTHERAVSLSEEDVALFEEIKVFVIEHVKKWHLENPQSLEVKDESQECWEDLCKMVGPFVSTLSSVELNFADDGASIVEAAEGVALGSWAAACPVLNDVVGGVRRWIATGSPDEQEDDDDTDAAEDSSTSPTTAE